MIRAWAADHPIWSVIIVFAVMLFLFCAAFTITLLLEP